ncbi:23S rRNA (adenine(1618)-N(6))-methyltransferase RlmF [Flavobacterium amniphilum]|uniref:23S rRNA (adenine(1618)-N(6))-methyltransferase RlmF n=1 Tax=Flavobacterium amniphilum TaxID=1834035 RepID=UPI00202A635C|nr:23S rRNA (adenine(1618)-N(6))-methyltransferase RlmF [Flavobacterium amniphilum]MCL9805792.1 23S rRNA (adenine(1618)-N(6))-methyltransferase RlmF [Flavobacterium amniphilum]MCL9806379.1 23S rRNA (adenine(1618)-N(6))-methyltransferase RlmF [Flavobacterium amniphilum]
MKPNITPEKKNLHPRNPHRFGYDFEQLVLANKELKEFLTTNKFNPDSDEKTIDFSNPKAVKALNKALLISHYNIADWDIPENYLCPPIPGRADYIHYIADLLAETNNKIIPEGLSVQGLDIGIGANCIYPIIGNAVYNWSFIGTDTNEESLQSCKKTIQKNPKLIDSVSLQKQTESRFIFKNIIEPEDRFAFTICNPPFHASAAEAVKATSRKAKNLQYKQASKPVLNFGGQHTELWCNGGEIGFLTQMIYESVKYPQQVLWFTTLISKKENLNKIYKLLKKVGAIDVKTIDMAQGQKTSRMVAWTFQSEAQRKNWKF